LISTSYWIPVNR
ncbi:flp pilus assembly TadG domain protein, partial [Vibrio parahaemolyticus V-223/04]